MQRYHRINHYNDKGKIITELEKVLVNLKVMCLTSFKVKTLGTTYTGIMEFFSR
jgi:hypothetical protein